MEDKEFSEWGKSPESSCATRQWIRIAVGHDQEHAVGYDAAGGDSYCRVILRDAAIDFVIDEEPAPWAGSPPRSGAIENCPIRRSAQSTAHKYLL